LQIQTLEKMKLGKEYTAYELKCYTKTLGALVREGYAEYVNKNDIFTKSDPMYYLKFKKIRDYKRKL